MESGEHARVVCAPKITQAHKLVWMHAIFLHAQANICAKWGPIREIKVYIGSGEHAEPL